MELKDLPFNAAYSINDNGSIIVSKRTGHRLKASVQLVKGKPSGYLYATLCNGVDSEGGFTTILPKRLPVHRMVAFTWLGDPPTPKHNWVNHKDGNKANNHYSNLEWTTISQNIQHKFNTGLHVMPKGVDHWKYGKEVSKETRAKMSATKIGAKHPKFKGYYYANFKRFESANQAAKYFGIPTKTILNRCNNENFRLKGYYFVPVNKE